MYEKEFFAEFCVRVYVHTFYIQYVFLHLFTYTIY